MKITSGKSITLSLTVLLVLMILSMGYGCSPQQEVQSPPSSSIDYSDSKTSLDWKQISLTDVRTGEAFTVSDFTGTAVLVESFAVWCPVCTKQQKEIQKLHQEMGEAVVSISLDTDANEDVQIVREAVQERGFTWRFAISPPELTNALIAEFGSAVVNAPFAPVILVCEDQSARLLGGGAKSVEKLKTELELGC